VENPNKCSPKKHKQILLEKRGQEGEFVVLEIFDFQSPKEGECPQECKSP
jgi:hypothetical protein